MEVASAAGRQLLTRAWAAACAFFAMVLIAWLAAFARALFKHGWPGFATLSAAGLSDATAQAGRYEAALVPVLAVWAVLLLLVPAGYIIAFRAALAAAAVLGALNFAPPSFIVTSWVTGFTGDLAHFTRSWNGIVLLVASVAAAFVLHQGALSGFERLDGTSAGRRRGSAPASLAVVFAARACCVALSLVVLLAAIWSGTVVWLAAAHTHVPRYLIFSVAGVNWPGSPWPGRDLVWEALFAVFPACLLGMYLVTRLGLVRGRRLLGEPAALDLSRRPTLGRGRAALLPQCKAVPGRAGSSLEAGPSPRQYLE